MTGAWGRILAQYGQRVTLRRGEEERGCRAFLQPVRERREDWYQELPTPLGTVRRDQWLYLGPPELSLEETNGLCVEWNGLRFAVRAAQPVCVGEETLYWWALLAGSGAGERLPYPLFRRAGRRLGRPLYQSGL